MNHFISMKYISAFMALWAYDNFVAIYSDMAHNACNLRGTEELLWLFNGASKYQWVHVKKKYN